MRAHAADARAGVYVRCPDLVPEPLDADLDVDPPFVTMSVLPGSPLTGVVDIEQQVALAASLRDCGRYRPPISPYAGTTPPRSMR
jgi:hypothetical protein